MENTANEKDVFLAINNLQKVYPNGEQAVYNFNLDIERNEFIVIVGPSGCGKSTTLRMIAGLEDVTAGEIFANGELLNYKPSKDRKIAIVFQSYALYPQMTVYDNIAFPLAMNKFPFNVVDTVMLSANSLKGLVESQGAEFLKQVYDEAIASKDKKISAWEYVALKLNLDEYTAHLLVKLIKECTKQGGEVASFINKSCDEMIEAQTKKLSDNHRSVNDKCEVLDGNGNVVVEQRNMTPFEIKKKVYETSSILDLNAYLDKFPRELSGGQMQRVALGRAIVKNVPLFLMDEPLSNLDAKLRLTMRSEIVKIHNRIGATTIYVTHDQAEAMTMASRIVVMSRGFVQQIGTPEEIYDNPANLFVAKFIGSPAINTLFVRYNGTDTLEVGNGMSITMPQGTKERHDEFYADLSSRLSAMLDNFDKEADENILKIQSALSMSAKKREEKKTSLFATIKNLFKKKEEVIPYEEEKTVCAQKLEQVKTAMEQEHDLIACIRPEKINLRLYSEGEKTAENEVVVTASVCELLGAEYYVHTDFAGHEVVAHFPTGKKIKSGDKFVMTFNAESIMLFDPITGGRMA